jgi:LmbE family N-acetylglucosaminyl deacetylase
MPNVVLSVLAHPDDAEFLCAGTMIRLLRLGDLGDQGWEGHMASMTPGDCGSAELPAEEISRIRRAEGAKAAALIGATYHCLEERDLLIAYNERTLAKVTHLLREVRPRIVFTHSPSDYMVDHEMTSLVTRAACFGAPIPNFFKEQGLQPMDHIPHLYYCDPIEGKDLLGRNVAPSLCIDISSVLETKAAMLTAHASQRDWLLKHHGMDEYILRMKAWAAERGRLCNSAAAEGFRQHLGHSYPQDDLLRELLRGTARPGQK